MKLDSAIEKLEELMGNHFLSPYYEFVSYVDFLLENPSNAENLLKHMLSFFGSIPKDGIAIGVGGISRNSWNELVSSMQSRAVFFVSEVRELDLEAVVDLLRKELKKFELLDEKAAFMYNIFRRIAPFRKADTEIQMSEREFHDRISRLRRTTMELESINKSPLLNSITKGAETFRAISSLQDPHDQAAVTRWLAEKGGQKSVSGSNIENILDSIPGLSGGMLSRDPFAHRHAFGGDEPDPFLDFLEDLMMSSGTEIPVLKAGEDCGICPDNEFCDEAEAKPFQKSRKPN